METNTNHPAEPCPPLKPRFFQPQPVHLDYMYALDTLRASRSPSQTSTASLSAGTGTSIEDNMQKHQSCAQSPIDGDDGSASCCASSPSDTNRKCGRRRAKGISLPPRKSSSSCTASPVSPTFPSLAPSLAPSRPASTILHIPGSTDRVFKKTTCDRDSKERARRLPRSCCASTSVKKSLASVESLKGTRATKDSAPRSLPALQKDVGQAEHREVSNSDSMPMTVDEIVLGNGARDQGCANSTREPPMSNMTACRPMFLTKLPSSGVSCMKCDHFTTVPATRSSSRRHTQSATDCPQITVGQQPVLYSRGSETPTISQASSQTSGMCLYSMDTSTSSPGLNSSSRCLNEPFMIQCQHTARLAHLNCSSPDTNTSQPGDDGLAAAKSQSLKCMSGLEHCHSLRVMPRDKDLCGGCSSDNDESFQDPQAQVSSRALTHDERPDRPRILIERTHALQSVEMCDDPTSNKMERHGQLMPIGPQANDCHSAGQSELNLPIHQSPMFTNCHTTCGFSQSHANDLIRSTWHDLNHQDVASCFHERSSINYTRAAKSSSLAWDVSYSSNQACGGHDCASVSTGVDLPQIMDTKNPTSDLGIFGAMLPSGDEMQQSWNTHSSCVDASLCNLDDCDMTCNDNCNAFDCGDGCNLLDVCCEPCLDPESCDNGDCNDACCLDGDLNRCHTLSDMGSIRSGDPAQLSGVSMGGENNHFSCSAFAPASAFSTASTMNQEMPDGVDCADCVNPQNLLLNCHWEDSGNHCDVAVGSYDSLKRHVLQNHIQPQAILPCKWNECNDQVEIEEILTHVLHEHGPPDQTDSYVCLWQGCGQHFESTEALDSHMKIEHCRINCHWDGCEEATASGLALKKHVDDQHIFKSGAIGSTLHCKGSTAHQDSNTSMGMGPKPYHDEDVSCDNNTIPKSYISSSQDQSAITASRDLDPATTVPIPQTTLSRNAGPKTCQWIDPDTLVLCAQILPDGNRLQAHIEETHLPRLKPTVSCAQHRCPNSSRHRTNDSHRHDHHHHHHHHSSFTCHWASCHHHHNHHNHHGPEYKSKSTFPERSKLARHIYTHTAYMIGSCRHCGKEFNNLNQLQDHERAHTNERPYVCDVCGFSASNKPALRTHSRIHTGEKPLRCETCGYTCSDPSNMSKHRKTHEAPVHQCEVCGRGFCRMATLKRHMRIHEAGRSKAKSEKKLKSQTHGQ